MFKHSLTSIFPLCYMFNLGTPRAQLNLESEFESLPKRHKSEVDKTAGS